MIRKSLLTLILAAVISTVGLTGCGVTGQSSGKILQNSNENESDGTEKSVKENSEKIDWEAMAGKVTFPSEYMISYDVACEDGSIITVTKGSDSTGNIYYQDADVEEVFVKTGNDYRLFTKDKNGEFTKENNSIYKEEYIEKATKEFQECAKQNSIMVAGSAKNEGTITIAERNCNYYSISVGFANFVQCYEYAFDEETGICLAKTEQKTISGHIQEGDSGFTCVDFQTSNVKFDLPNE